jgi:CO dehydrogenase maturation factor
MLTVAVTGKGGVGKTTIAAGIARAFARRGKRVIALDMDPSPNLSYSLGCVLPGGSPLLPLAEQEALIRERTGAPSEGGGNVFRINPDLSDIPARFGILCRDNVRLLVMGAIRTGGSGCFCPVHAFVRQLVREVARDADVLVMDMEAGVEHLGRGTTRSATVLLVVVEPGEKSLATGLHVAKLARDLAIPGIYTVLNKWPGNPDPKTLRRLEDRGAPAIFSIPKDPAVAHADCEGKSVYDDPDGAIIRELTERLAERIEGIAGRG